MKASKQCVDFIASYEGFSPKACKAVSTEKYYTIGYGHYGKDVKVGQVISKEGALKLLAHDIEATEYTVNNLNEKGLYNMTQNQFDALVSFCYNCGQGNLYNLADSGKRSMKVISEKILLYNKSGGKELKGLTLRRQDEQEMLLKSDYKRR